MVEKNQFAMLILLLIRIFTTFAGENSGIQVIGDIGNIRAAVNSGAVFYLNDFFEGQDISYSLTGQFMNGVSGDLPTMTQGMNLLYSSPKKYESTPTNDFELIQVHPFDSNILYIIENQNLTFWDVAEQEIVSSYLMPFQGDIISAIPYLVNGFVYSVVLQVTPGGFKSSLLNTTDYENINAFPSMTLLVSIKGSVIGASLYSTVDDIYQFVVLSSPTYQILVIHYGLSAMEVKLFNQLNSASVQLSSFAPVSVVFNSITGYICDSANGVYEFDATDFLSTVNQTLTVVKLLSDPQDFGETFSCNINTKILSVGTSTGIALYSLPTLSFVKKLSRYQRSAEKYLLENLPRMSVASQYLIMGYYVSNSTSRFRVSYLSSNIENLLFDVDTHQLFGNDSSLDPTPPYVHIIDNKAGDVVIFSTPNKIWAFQTVLNPSFMIGALNESYLFSGAVTLQTPNEIFEISFNLHGIDPRDSTIYPWRGNSLTDGFLNPPAIQLYTNILIAQENTQFYLPLSNYFSGQDLTYELDVTDPIEGCEITIIMPPKNNLIAVSNVGSLSYSPTLISGFDGNTYILLAIPGTNANSYVYSLSSTGTYLQNTLKCSDTSKTASLGATFWVMNRYIIIECIAETPDTGLFNVDWDIYAVDENYAATYLSTYSTLQTLLSEKLGYVCSYFYALKGDQIQLFSVSMVGATVTLSPLSAISGDTLSGIGEFLPIDVVNGSLCQLFIYDLNLGLLLITLPDTPITQNSYSFMLFGVVGDIGSTDVQLNYLGTQLFVISTQSNSPFSLVVASLISQTLEVSRTLPVMPNCAYSSLSATQDFLTVFCQDIEMNRVLVFDYHTPYAIESLYSTIDFNQVGSIAARRTDRNILYVYTGLSLYTYIINQVAPHFSRLRQSDMIPYSFYGATTWALLQFNFTQPPSEPVITGIIKLTAKNDHYSNATDIQFQFLSRGTVVQINGNYDNDVSVLTSGNKVKVVETQYVTPIPESAFIGNNINFGLEHKNGTQIYASSQCNLVDPICVLGKYSIDETFTYDGLQAMAFDMTQFEELLYVSIPNHILVYDISSSPYKLLTTYNLTEINGSYSTNCYKIQAIPSHKDVLVLSCSEFSKQSSTYSTNYLTAVNLTDISSNFQIPASYIAVILEIVIDTTQTYPIVYVYDSQDIKVYELTKGEPQYILSQYTIIDPDYFSLNNFFIDSIMYLNSTDLILLEDTEGFLWLKLVASPSSAVEYELASIISTQSLLANYGKLSFKSAILLSDLKTIISCDSLQGTFIFKIQSANIHLTDQIPPLNAESVYWINSIAVYENQKIIAYPYTSSTNDIFLRILNYSQPIDNAIYTDILLPGISSLTAGSDVRILFSGSDKALELLILAKNITNQPSEIAVLTLRLMPLVIYNPIGKEDSADMQLFAYITDSGSKVMLGEARVVFSPKDAPETHSSGGDSTPLYKEWYVWVIVGGIAAFLIVLAIVIYFIIRRRRHHSKEGGVSLIENLTLNA